MKNFEKGFVVPLLLAIIALLAIGGGAYIYQNKKSASYPITQQGSDFVPGLKTYVSGAVSFSLPTNWQVDDQTYTRNWRTFPMFKVTSPDRTDLPNNIGKPIHYLVTFTIDPDTKRILPVAGFQETGLTGGQSAFNTNIDAQTEKTLAEYQLGRNIVDSIKYNPVSNNTVSNGTKTYTNTKYGFTLNFPDAWNGYLVKEGVKSNADFISFGIRDQDGVFTILVFTKAQWADYQKGEIQDVGYIAQNDAYVFGYGHAQDYTNSAAPLARLIPSIISTFKLNKVSASAAPVSSSTVITSVLPSPVSAGARVDIGGTNFPTSGKFTPIVYIGSTKVTGVSGLISSTATDVAFTTPNLAPGTYDLSVGFPSIDPITNAYSEIKTNSVKIIIQ